MPYFICSNCGYGSASWLGRCPDCGQWNTLTERKDITGLQKGEPQNFDLTPLSSIKMSKKNRLPTGIFEFDRVLGGGFVPGEVILLTGEPGIGKSTLLLQSLQHLKTIYISGEESVEQIKERAHRLKINLKSFLFSNTLQVEGIIKGIEDFKKPIDIIVVDSIQTIYSQNIDSTPGAISQLKESTEKLIKLAKKIKIPFILIGHITKGGEIAGPKTLEHLVDCVIAFEGEKVSPFRILRAAKNRFGSTDEIGIFEMKHNGLQEVNNPTIFLENESDKTSGKAIAGISEGKRSLFFEIQTLAVPTVLAVPRRVVKGVDYNKVLLLLAVTRKLLNLQLDKFDVYINVVGGVEIKSTAADLAIVASVFSSFYNILIPKKTVFCGEVGLLGEVRKVFFEEKIITDARRLKFQQIFSFNNLKTIKDLKKIISSYKNLF